MERLTRKVYLGIGRIDDFPSYECRFVLYKDGNFIGHEAKDMTIREVKKCLDKLVYYEDLDERGMVIRNGEPQKCFANIIFDKDDLQKMVDEKASEIELNINKIKKQTINDFVAMLYKYSFSNNITQTFIVLTSEQLGYMLKHLKVGEK